MANVEKIILNYVCPSLGIITSLFMYSAPVETMKVCLQRGSLGFLNPTPWAFMTGNCGGWIAYSYITQDWFLFWANTPGFILSVWLNMCAAKLQYQDYMSVKLKENFITLLCEQSKVDDDLFYENKGSVFFRKQNFSDLIPIVKKMGVEDAHAPISHEKKVVLIVTFWVAVITCISFIPMTLHQKEQAIGYICNINLLFFYGAPLTVIFTVISTRSSATLHCRTMLLNAFNGSFWFAYGLYTNKWLVAVPNGIGALFGFIQIILAVIFPRRELNEEDLISDSELLESDEDFMMESDGMEDLYDEGATDISETDMSSTSITSRRGSF